MPEIIVVLSSTNLSTNLSTTFAKTFSLATVWPQALHVRCNNVHIYSLMPILLKHTGRQTHFNQTCSGVLHFSPLNQRFNLFPSAWPSVSLILLKAVWTTVAGQWTKVLCSQTGSFFAREMAWRKLTINMLNQLMGPVSSWPVFPFCALYFCLSSVRLSICSITVNCCCISIYK